MAQHPVGETKEVHVLRWGRALCPALIPLLFPKDWPEGHKWVGIQQHEDATCEPCKQRALEILEAEHLVSDA